MSTFMLPPLKGAIERIGQLFMECGYDSDHPLMKDWVAIGFALKDYQKIKKKTTMETPPAKKAFKIGDRVEWSSQAGDFWSIKIGTVVEVVNENFRPNRERFPDLYKNAGCGMYRNYKSYVIKINGKGNKHYWPIASKLKHLTN